MPLGGQTLPLLVVHEVAHVGYGSACWNRLHLLHGVEENDEDGHDDQMNHQLLVHWHSCLWCSVLPVTIPRQDSWSNQCLGVFMHVEKLQHGEGLFKRMYQRLYNSKSTVTPGLTINPRAIAV